MSFFQHYLPTVWEWTLALIELVSVAMALPHVLLRKKDPRAAAYWVALILLVPFLGPLLYLLFGINIIRRSGRRYRDERRREGAAEENEIEGHVCWPRCAGFLGHVC